MAHTPTEQMITMTASNFLDLSAKAALLPELVEACRGALLHEVDLPLGTIYRLKVAVAKAEALLPKVKPC